MWLPLAIGLAVATAQPAPPSGDPTESTAPEELPPLLKDPALIDFVQAPYPPQAEADRVEGVVGLLIEIDETGAVTTVEVLQSIGSGLDEAAVEAAQQFRFSPAEDATGPVPVAIEFAYGFVLDSRAIEAPPDAVAAQPDTAPLPAPVNLGGVLLEMGTRTPLAGVSIRVVDADGAVHDVVTDDSGAWEIPGAAVGLAEVAAAQTGYARSVRSVEVVAGERTDLRLWLKNLSYRDNEVVAVYHKASEDVSRRTLTIEEVRRVPGTFGDPIRVIQNLPGAARSPMGSGLLVIRGANPEDSGVYVDGIRIPLIYHIGGYVSVITPDLVSSVDYLPGSYGVPFGRSMGGAIDVRTRQPDGEVERLRWSTDAIDSGGIYEGKLGDNWATAIAGRHSYIEYLIPLFTGDSGFVVKPRWWDYQVKLNRLTPGRDRLSITAIGFQDQLQASTPSDYAQGTDQSTQGDLGSTYTTHRLYLQWTHPFSDTLSLEVVPAIGVDGVDFRLGEEFRIAQWQLIPQGRAELTWAASDAVSVDGGIDLIGGAYWFTTELPFDPDSFSDYDPLGEREPWTTKGRGHFWSPDVYAEVDLRPLKNRDTLLITPGLRLNTVWLNDAVNTDLRLRMASVDPRLAAMWQVIRGGTLKAGVGYYHQPPMPFEAWRPEGNVELLFERALSTELGWSQFIGQAVQADASLFYKELSHLIVENPDYQGLADEYFTNEGVGRAYGLELMLRHAPVHRFFGWVSYTLSRSERNDYPDRVQSDGDAITPGNPDQGEWYPFELDQTHILVAVGGWRLPRDWEVSAKVQYVTGNPYTPYSNGVYDMDQDYYFPYATGQYNSARLPAYFAFDARIDKLITFKRWQLELYLDLLNILRGENPEFTVYNYDYTDSRYIRGLPFIPSPGFEAEYRF